MLSLMRAMMEKRLRCLRIATPSHHLTRHFSSCCPLQKAIILNQRNNHKSLQRVQ